MGNATRWGLCVLAIAAGVSPSPSAARTPSSRAGESAHLGHRPALSLHPDDLSPVEGRANPTSASSAPTRRLTISDIDIQDGTAEVAGPAGPPTRHHGLSDGSLYFMENTRGSLE